MMNQQRPPVAEPIRYEWPLVAFLVAFVLLVVGIVLLNNKRPPPAASAQAVPTYTLETIQYSELKSVSF